MFWTGLHHCNLQGTLKVAEFDASTCTTILPFSLFDVAGSVGIESFRCSFVASCVQTGTSIIMRCQTRHYRHQMRDSPRQRDGRQRVIGDPTTLPAVSAYPMASSPSGHPRRPFGGQRVLSWPLAVSASESISKGLFGSSQKRGAAGFIATTDRVRTFIRSVIDNFRRSDGIASI